MESSKKNGKGKGLLCKVGGVFAAAGIFAGVFLLLAVSLALISGGMFTVPAAVLRITDRGDALVSDLPQYTMLFSGLAMLFAGVALLTASACRICPAAAEKLLKLFGRRDGR